MDAFKKIKRKKRRRSNSIFLSVIPIFYHLGSLCISSYYPPPQMKSDQFLKKQVSMEDKKEGRFEKKFFTSTVLRKIHYSKTM